MVPFIDYVTLMLINATAGLVVLAVFVYKDLDDATQRRWAPPFVIAGGILVATGLHMAFTWPLPGSFNPIYSEMAVLFGALLLGAALAIAKGWDLMPLTIYALFAGIQAVIAGVGFIRLGLTDIMPWLPAAGFILTGVAGVLALPAWMLRTNRSVRLAGAAVLLAAAAIWALSAFMGFYMHMSGFKEWKPATAYRQPAPR